MNASDSSVLEKLGKMIAAARKSAKLSRRALAAKLSYSATTLWRIESGKRDMGLFELKQLFAACGFIYTLRVVKADDTDAVIAVL